tara:strand:- start:51508 stop:51897 length:390 start_codon:yes stop_codon:yes gene_type:complete
MNSYVALSFSDLMLDQEWQEGWKYDDKKKLNKVLWKYGIDVKNKESVEEQFCEHRNLQGQVVKCTRYVGVERKDRDYMSSGIATLEGHFAVADPETRNDMASMSRRYNNSAHLMSNSDDTEDDEESTVE